MRHRLASYKFDSRNYWRLCNSKLYKSKSSITKWLIFLSEVHFILMIFGVATWTEKIISLNLLVKLNFTRKFDFENIYCSKYLRFWQVTTFPLPSLLYVFILYLFFPLNNSCSHIIQHFPTWCFFVFLKIKWLKRLTYIALETNT